jgi:hypothetical protein
VIAHTARNRAYVVRCGGGSSVGGADEQRQLAGDLAARAVLLLAIAACSLRASRS